MFTTLDRFLTRSRTVIGISSLAVAATAIAGCGATTTGGSISIPSLSVGGGTTPSASPGATSGQLGDTLVMEDAGDDFAHVTLLKVFDPATGLRPEHVAARWHALGGIRGHDRHRRLAIR